MTGLGQEWSQRNDRSGQEWSLRNDRSGQEWSLRNELSELIGSRA